MMEEDSSDVVQVAGQCKHTLSGLSGPNLDGVVITTRDKDWLSRMESDTSDRTVVIFKTIDQSTHTIIPQLNGGRV
jgi:hypothetical protein